MQISDHAPASCIRIIDVVSRLQGVTHHRMTAGNAPKIIFDETLGDGTLANLSNRVDGILEGRIALLPIIGMSSRVLADDGI